MDSPPDLDGTALAEAINAVGHNDVPGIHAIRDRGTVALGDPESDRSHNGFPVANDIDEGALRALLHSGGRYDELRALRVCEQLHIDELRREQCVIAVLEHGFDAHRACGLID